MTDTLQSSGKIYSVQLCPGRKKPMLEVQQAEAVTNFGLKGDRHALADSSRQILLIEKETLDTLRLKPGEVKENITTTGVELMKLTYGDKLRLGNDVMLEMTSACSPCNRMDEIRQGLLREIAGRRGMLARVVHGGIVSRGDSVSVIKR